MQFTKDELDLIQSVFESLLENDLHDEEIVKQHMSQVELDKFVHDFELEKTIVEKLQAND